MTAILQNWAGGIAAVVGSVFVQLAAQMFLARTLAARASTGLTGPLRVQALWTSSLLTVFTLIFGHLAQVFLWALLYLALQAFDAFADAAYFSLASYTTVGAVDVELPRTHRTLGALEAGVGVLMFGWSTALLVALIGRIEGQREGRDT